MGKYAIKQTIIILKEWWYGKATSTEVSTNIPLVTKLDVEGSMHWENDASNKLPVKTEVLEMSEDDNSSVFGSEDLQI
ncbi:MAG UNVERIFIED_CONTAM: hypothetical protein LVQ98_06860 [Rickettsiaceae bacterium]|jgi:hypothetical protein